MAEQDPPLVIDPNQVADIASYVRHHQIAADQLTGLIVERHRALACPTSARAGEAGGADPTLGTAGLRCLSRMRPARPNCAPPFAGKA
jgi:hypothetical protein